ncbi:tRNA pseudouridine(55) synthase TruB [Desulfoferrobacter suflitae]|uniref:tRNA pseudouridine(55) synthase TruB n=1 Tax=Desulfoferrobacter suflitae TaxID=2865782 RepID=UPI00216496F0|nr:tRNA pseudouridine(55) synthase TruB [Desulfoferrobacter suflitae]MCK8602353.1 tRNA pseudouridine(55) synthase TruB [Desulfoferrobacter suflitae]
MKMTSEAEFFRCAQSDVGSSPAADSGILIVDKPEGLTSFAVVARVKKSLKLKKVGHCGTLDPFATGVLVLCINQATRIADQLSLQDKLYRFTLHFGVQTDTLDRTGQVVQTYDGPAVDESDLAAAAHGFVGIQRQQVPRYAAVKVQGRRLYELARKGVEVPLPERDITIHRLRVIRYHWPEAIMEARCSKGTYIRQLAADIGHRLGCGAHVNALRRLASGSFDICQAISMEELKSIAKDNRWREKLISMSEALDHLPAMVIKDRQILQGLDNGHLDPAWVAEKRGQFARSAGPVRLLTGAAPQLLALWWPGSSEDAHSKRHLRVFT